jgi:hypothetical protein
LSLFSIDGEINGEMQGLVDLREFKIKNQIPTPEKEGKRVLKSIFFLSVPEFELRASHLLAGILPLEPPCQPCFVLGVFRIWS